MKRSLFGHPGVHNLSRRYREVVLASAVVGVSTGLVVAAFEKVTAQWLFDSVLDLPVWVQVIAPAAGLGLAFVVLKFIGRGASPATADEYLHAFHDSHHELLVRPALARLVAAVATLGFGGALGYEGPSVYAGATIGARLERRLPRLFAAPGRRALLVAGAAAGVAAIFKAPATGAVFALEVPYQDDLARRSLLPALIGAASGYLTYVAIIGTTPLFTVAGRPPFDLRDLGGALAIGVVCGIGARAYAALLRRSKALVGQLDARLRLPLAGAILAACAVASWAAFDGETLSLGAGYDALRWSLDPARALWLILLLILLRTAASAATLAGGGVGGLFVPLVVEGALVGRLISGLIGDPSSTLFPVLGIAAFLGAGYRVPLAGIMFVAETTGQPFFVVPGLIAAVTADVLAGRSSVTTYQQVDRETDLVVPASRPISDIVQPVGPTISGSDLVADIPRRQRDDHDLLVTDPNDDRHVLGVLRWSDIDALDAGTATTTDATTLTDATVPRVESHLPMADAAEAMVAARVDVLAVVDDLDHHVGSVALNDVLRAVGLLPAGSDDPTIAVESTTRRTGGIKRAKGMRITRPPSPD